MNKITFFGFILSGLLASAAYAQATQITASPQSLPVVTWISESPADVKTVENKTGIPYTVQIIVNDDGTDNAAGINVTNCGQTTHVGPGSTALCNTTTTNNPVSFNSDRGKPASGTYQLQAPAP